MDVARSANVEERGTGLYEHVVRRLGGHGAQRTVGVDGAVDASRHDGTAVVGVGGVQVGAVLARERDAAVVLRAALERLVEVGVAVALRVDGEAALLDVQVHVLPAFAGMPVAGAEAAELG